MAFIKRKFEWMENQEELINWEAHGMVARKNYARKRFFVKYIHNWLPLGHLVARYGRGDRSNCPCCGEETENRNHFLTCAQNRKWVDECLLELNGLFARFPTRPALKDILFECIKAEASNRENVYHFPECYKTLIANQSKAGWIQIFFARFVQEWSTLQSEFLSGLKKRSPRHTGDAWVTQTANIILQNVHKLWLKRNEAKHGVDAEAREIAKYDRAARETEDLYKLKMLVQPKDRDVFYNLFEEHLEMESTSRGLQQWLATNKPVILISFQRAKQSGQHQHKSITTFFTQH